MIVRTSRELYGGAGGRPGGAPSPEGIFEVGARCYLEHPRLIKLTLGEAHEDRLDELVLMLAQSRAAHTVLEIWEATEGGDYAATREEYTALADEFERLRGLVSPLRAEIETLSREVTVLESKLRSSGGEPEAVEPPFPKGVGRPSTQNPTEDAPKWSPLGGLWRFLFGTMEGRGRAGR